MRAAVIWIRIGAVFLGSVMLSGASVAETKTWHRASSLDGILSVETLCNSVEIDSYRDAPADISEGILLQRESRVVCGKGDILQVVGVTQLNEIPAQKSAFEFILADFRRDPELWKSLSIVRIDGRRAIFNREIRSGETGETGFIELEGNRMVVILTGVGAASGLSELERAATLDHFSQSLKIARK